MKVREIQAAPPLANLVVRKFYAQTTFSAATAPMSRLLFLFFRSAAGGRLARKGQGRPIQSSAAGIKVTEEAGE